MNTSCEVQGASSCFGGDFQDGAGEAGAGEEVGHESEVGGCDGGADWGAGSGDFGVVGFVGYLGAGGVAQVWGQFGVYAEDVEGTGAGAEEEAFFGVHFY